MRLAVFTPLPPERTGIAAYSAELLPALAGALDGAIDVFVDAPAASVSRFRVPGQVAVWSAFDFQPRHLATPYDLVVYQLGNARCHDYMWPYLVRYPGLLVLHDAQLHHSRARALIARGREGDYRAEFAFSHPDAPANLSEFVVNGLQGSPYYLWPLRRVPLVASRAVATHNPRLTAQLAEEVPPGSLVTTIRMGTRPHAPAGRAPVGGQPVFAAVGGITPEKRIPQVLRAFARTLEVAPAARLLLVGAVPDYYDVQAEVEGLGIAPRVTLTGYVPDESLDDWLEAADVCLCLRWPTSRETSASWLRCLAAGKATITTDLAHTVDVPSLDPRTWLLLHASTRGADAEAPPPVGDAVSVAVDILDEDHSLEVAMRRLARDAPLRSALGARAREWWQAHHTLDAMVADYLAVITATLATPPRPAGADALPAHLLDGAEGTMDRLLREVGVARPW